MAQIIKIIEATLEAGATTLTVTNAAIPYSIIAVNCDKYGTYPATMTVSGTSLTLTYEVQNEELHLAISLIKADLAVIDDLTSDSQTDALSAAQGKALKALIDNIVVTGTLSGLDDVDLTGLTAGDILVYDAVNQKWINASQPAIPSDISDLDDVSITSPVNGQCLLYNNGDWINGNVSGGGVDYSTTEQDTGLKYTDGKTVYQKTLHLSTVNSGTSYNHDIANVDRIWIHEISAVRNVGWFSSGHIFQDAYNNISESFSIIPSATVLYAYLYNCTITDCDVTVRYTKSS